MDIILDADRNSYTHQGIWSCWRERPRLLLRHVVLHWLSGVSSMMVVRKRGYFSKEKRDPMREVVMMKSSVC